MLICNIYRPGSTHPNLTQNQLFHEFINLFSNQLQNIVDNDHTMYIARDLNLDLLKYNQSLQTNEYVDLLYSFGFYHTISKPTRITNSCATVIDHIATNRPCTNIESAILITDVSDHFPILHFFQEKQKNNDPKTYESQNFSDQNLLLFREALNSINWAPLYYTNDAQLAYDLFEENFQTLYDLYFPIVTVKFNRNIHKLEKWMTTGLMISRTVKNNLYKVSNRTLVNEDAYKKYRNIYNSLIRSAKKLYYEKQFSKFQSNVKNLGIFFILQSIKKQKIVNK